MGDPQEVKSKGQYQQWSEPEHKLLLRLLVEAINQGFRDADGKFNKLTVETRILPTLNKQVGSTKTYNQYKNRIKILKGRYRNLANFLRCNSGFGWNSETKKFTADDEAHPGNTHLRDEPFEDFEDLRTIFGQNVTTGQNAIGLGDTIDTQTSQINTEEINGTYFIRMVDDTEGFTYQQETENAGLSSSRTNMGEKLPPRKKARSETYNSIKACEDLNAMTELSGHIFGMIQKRWDKEAEEKEAEDKANNVWDAINEIPDLDENLRYETMTLVHSLGMKSGFVSMSITDRRGWINRNLRKSS